MELILSSEVLVGTSLLEKKWLTVCLATVVVVLGIFTAGNLKRLYEPPSVPGYSVADKKQIVVIAYRYGCSCGDNIKAWLSIARNHNVPVLLVASSKTLNFEEWMKIYSHENVYFYNEAGIKLMDMYSPKKITTLNILNYGKIVYRSSDHVGGVPLDDLLRSVK